MEGKYCKLETNKIIKDLIRKLERRQRWFDDDFHCTPAKANKYFDGRFGVILRDKEILKKRYTPLELSKAIAQVRITIRNIFNNRPNIRLNSDKKA
ncbi:MAG: hypothetical protein ACFNTA_08165 [Campylobacter sp.]|uniref:hypothetical protein n=1 Tax=Campylobacter sp. TaxID=205 RepID=UPI003614FD22